MKIQLLVDDRKGNIVDISDLVTEATWKTSRKGKPSSLDFQFLKDSQVNISNGNIISFKVDNMNVFHGYVFKNGGSKDPSLKITAYDQIRYLLYNDTYKFLNTKASDITRRILKDAGLNIGEIEDTSFAIPKLVEDDKKLLDIIYSTLEKTTMTTGQTYVLYDDYGSVNLKNINNMKQRIVISDDSNLGDYDWENSIDAETYNRIKLVRDNKETKGRDIYITQDSASMANWGRLQYFKKVDEKMTDAQVNEMGKSLIKLKNREQKTLKLKEVISTELVEDLKLRGGSGVFVDIKERNVKQYYLIEEATHKFSNETLIMDFDLKVV